jgi:hypothetical protein
LNRIGEVGGSSRGLNTGRRCLGDSGFLLKTVDQTWPGSAGPNHCRSARRVSLATRLTAAICSRIEEPRSAPLQKDHRSKVSVDAVKPLSALLPPVPLTRTPWQLKSACTNSCSDHGILRLVTRMLHPSLRRFRVVPTLPGPTNSDRVRARTDLREVQTLTTIRAKAQTEDYIDLPQLNSSEFKKFQDEQWNFVRNSTTQEVAM